MTGSNPENIHRRDFLRVGSLAAISAAIPSLSSATSAATAKNCIVLFLVGGPSQLDTFDPKPEAPSSVRGPFSPIRTSIPGIHLTETLPRTAAMMDRITLVRSVTHTAAPIHETGQQLLQTGQLFRDDGDVPSLGARFSAKYPGIATNIVIPGRIESTGVSVSHGQGAGNLGSSHEAMIRNAQPKDQVALERYGRSTFGRNVLLAREMLEAGSRFVTVNMFQTVFGETTWDCHADGGSLASTLDDYRTTLCPSFDMAYTALLADLEVRGLLKETLVVAMGEFGRTPRLNARGGRDHWAGVWSVLLAGGGVRGGQVVGSSDAHGAEPKDRPVDASEIAGTIAATLGIC